MKVKEMLPLLPFNQETEIHCKDYGKYCCYPQGLTGKRSHEANILKIETDYMVEKDLLLGACQRSMMAYFLDCML